MVVAWARGIAQSQVRTTLNLRKYSSILVNKNLNNNINRQLHQQRLFIGNILTTGRHASNTIDTFSPHTHKVRKKQKKSCS